MHYYYYSLLCRRAELLVGRTGEVARPLKLGVLYQEPYKFHTSGDFDAPLKNQNPKDEIMLVSMKEKMFVLVSMPNLNISNSLRSKTFKSFMKKKYLLTFLSTGFCNAIIYNKQI